MSPRTVLVVEDDRDIRETLEDALRDEGFSVVLAANGQEALDALEGISPPFAIVLDILMPVMNGREFYDHLRQDPRFAAVPVLVSTSDPTSAPAGVATMRKPVPLGTLLAKVRSFFDDPTPAGGHSGGEGRRVSNAPGPKGQSARPIAPWPTAS